MKFLEPTLLLRENFKNTFFFIVSVAMQRRRRRKEREREKGGGNRLLLSRSQNHSRTHILLMSDRKIVVRNMSTVSIYSAVSSI